MQSQLVGFFLHYILTYIHTPVSALSGLLHWDFCTDDAQPPGDDCGDVSDGERLAVIIRRQRGKRRPRPV